MNPMQAIHVVQGIPPVADALAGTVRTDVVDVSNFQCVDFFLQKGVGATGTSTITIEASDDDSPDNVQAIPFRYRKCISGDTWGAWTAVAATGVATTAESNGLYQFQVDTVELAKIGDTYKYVSLKAVEVANSPVLAGILIVLSEPRYARSIQPSVLD